MVLYTGLESKTRQRESVHVQNRQIFTLEYVNPTLVRFMLAEAVDVKGQRFLGTKESAVMCLVGDVVLWQSPCLAHVRSRVSFQNLLHRAGAVAETSTALQRGNFTSVFLQPSWKKKEFPLKSFGFLEGNLRPVILIQPAISIVVTEKKFYLLSVRNTHFSPRLF